MVRLRWFLAGMIAAATAYWARLAWRDRQRWSSTLYAVDPETGLRLPVALGPAELAAARDREAAAVLVG